MQKHVFGNTGNEKGIVNSFWAFLNLGYFVLVNISGFAGNLLVYQNWI